MSRSIKLPGFLGQYFLVFGGRYMQRPDHMQGVKMAVEINRPYTVAIPTRDFSVPDRAILDEGLLKAVKLIAQGQPLYVGCMGGVGRTGLFLAVLCKAWGIENPITYVRDNYNGHAVETSEQEAYVRAYEVKPEVLAVIKKTRWSSLLKLKKSLTVI